MAPLKNREPAPYPGCPNCPGHIKALKDAWEKILQLDEQLRIVREKLGAKND